jgi:hypothetical protein
MMIVASQAMAHVADASTRVYGVEAGNVDPETRARIVAAVSKPDFKRASAEIVALVANGFGDNGESLAGLLHLAQVSTWGQQDDQCGGAMACAIGNPDIGAGAPSPNNVGSGATCYSNCYSNCYSACHGSRGWR